MAWVSEEIVKQDCLIRGDGHPILMMNSDELFIRESMKLALSAEPTQKLVEEVRARFPELWGLSKARS